MAEIIVIQTAQKTNLNSFSQYLWQQKITHRIVQSSDRQLLLVGNREDAEQVHIAYTEHSGGKPLPENLQPNKEKPDASKLNPIKAFLSCPVTSILIVLSVLGFLIAMFDRQLDLMQYLTFYEYERIVGVNVWTVPSDDFWRLLTPIFLHFGWMHIIFNMLWLWELGRRVEKAQGAMTLLGITMTIGLGSNIAQFMYAEAAIFGGMSGVIYGLLGYCWMWSKLRKDPALAVPRPVMIFMIGSMFAFIFGFARLFGLGEVANAAHVGGLLMGLLMGFCAAMVDLSSNKIRK
jgi:GlpG protein